MSNPYAREPGRPSAPDPYAPSRHEDDGYGPRSRGRGAHDPRDRYGRPPQGDPYDRPGAGRDPYGPPDDPYAPPPAGDPYAPYDAPQRDRGGHRDRSDHRDHSDHAPRRPEPEPARPSRSDRSDRSDRSAEAAHAEAPDTPDEPLVPIAPRVRRLVSVAVAAWAGLLTAALVVGAQLPAPLFGIIGFGAAAVFTAVLAWTARPSAPWITLATGLACAAGAQIAAVYVVPLTLAPLAAITAAAFGLTLLGQLARRDGRTGLTESFAVSLTAAVGSVAFAMPVALTRHTGGTQILDGCLLAAGTAVIVARMSDATLPLPRIAPHVARGAFGIVLGAMVGTAVSAYAGVLLTGPGPSRAAAIGLVVSVTAVLADLAATYTDVGRRLAGERVAPWPVRYALGPLLAFALAAPATYLIGVLFLARGL